MNICIHIKLKYNAQTYLNNVSNVDGNAMIIKQ